MLTTIGKINKSIESVAWQTVIQVIYGSILSAPFHFISLRVEQGKRVVAMQCIENKSEEKTFIGVCMIVQLYIV